MIFLLCSSSYLFASDELTVSDMVFADLSLRNYLNNISVSLFEGKNNQNLINLNQDKHWIPASTVKTFAALYVFDQVDKGKLDLDAQYRIDGVNVVPTELDTPDLPSLTEGEYVSLDRLIRQMIIQSDNTAFNQLLDILGRKEITDYIHRIGLTHSAVGSKLNQDSVQEQSEFDVSGYGINTTTAEDYSKAFVLIKDKKIPGADELYSVFKDQRINNMIPLLLPKTVAVAHKTGDLDPLFHDGGIVSLPKRSYVLSIFSNLGDPDIIAHISYLVYSKDLSYVGAQIKKSISDVPKDYLDPLILSQFSQSGQNVLAASTSLEQFPITASDLGITADEMLSVPIEKKKKMSIPSDSPLFFAQPILKVIQEGLDPLDSFDSKLLEAESLLKQNKVKDAQTILESLTPQLSQFVKGESLFEPDKQQRVQEISALRFSLFKKELDSTKDQNQKKELIKAIAKAAKLEVKDIQPLIPKAIDSSSPSQKPLLGEVVKVSDDRVTVRSAGGQILEIPSSLTVKTRSSAKDKVLSEKIGEIKEGTSIALMGSFKEKEFVPTFVLTNLDRQLIAPQPVSVLKVDSKNKTMVVAENGNPVQVNISSQTNIRGTGTGVSLNSIKEGDVVIIRGNKLPISLPSKNSGQSQNANQNNNSGLGQSSTQGNQAPQSSPPASTGGESSSGSPNTRPTVIQSTSVQVIQKKENLKSTPSNSRPSKVESPKPPQPPSSSKEKSKGRKK